MIYNIRSKNFYLSEEVKFNYCISYKNSIVKKTLKEVPKPALCKHMLFKNYF